MLDDGIYNLTFAFSKGDGDKRSIEVSVEIKGRHGYLSPHDWPLLPFYGCMCAVYTIYGLLWFSLCLYYWRDILRLQIWIGVVILLGLIEKSVFVAEYDSINKTGKSLESSLNGAMLAAEIVSSLKRALSRMLVIIVSLGFGIVRPTLGKTLHKVIAVGVAFFAASCWEAVLRTRQARGEGSSYDRKMDLISGLPLAVVDSAICLWIFFNIVGTIRTLAIRKNMTKLSLYVHFRNTLVLAVIASVIFSIWTKYYELILQCQDVGLVWLADAYWHMLFSLILLVIIFLWRPGANNQRYAYSPLRDGDYNDDEETVEYERTHDHLGDVKKVRGKTSSARSGRRRSLDGEDENLKWVDENIPSVLEVELAEYIDDEEDIIARKTELSKLN